MLGCALEGVFFSSGAAPFLSSPLLAPFDVYIERRIEIDGVKGEVECTRELPVSVKPVRGRTGLEIIECILSHVSETCR